MTNGIEALKYLRAKVDQNDTDIKIIMNFDKVGNVTAWGEDMSTHQELEGLAYTMKEKIMEYTGLEVIPEIINGYNQPIEIHLIWTAESIQ